MNGPRNTEQNSGTHFKSLDLQYPEHEQDTGIRRIKKSIVLGCAAVSLAFQQSPGNEFTRSFAGLYALNVTGSPMIAGVVFGASTFAIETITGVSAAGALRAYSGNIQYMKDRVFDKFKRLKPSGTKKNSTIIGDTILALTIGSAAVVARRHYHSRNRSVSEDNRTVVKSAAGISIASLALAYGGARLISASKGTSMEKYVDGAMDLVADWRTLLIGNLAIGFGGGLLGYGKIKKEDREKNETPSTKKFVEVNRTAEVLDIDQESGNVCLRVVDNNSDIADEVIAFEQEIWYSKGYGSEDDYNKKYLKNTRLFATFNKEGECVGTTRLLVVNDIQYPPFIEAMKYYDDNERRSTIDGFNKGVIEELATASYDNSRESRRGAIKALWRVAYRDARSRGVESWGIVMEPKRAKLLNRYYGFDFKQIGPPVDYEGGMCSPHVMHFETALGKMKMSHPEMYNWFTE